ncbi:unnamed protein product [Paramecium pentaurelia]|uniref:Uncharacterized protein n=1 Tax=Paramecium pentaurelia TaxID=43138 RepID=A0A8S1XSS9_9CILI|nr:unnamed protein product [Paramecium pentaurelia]
MNNYNKSAKQRIEIDILKQYYSESAAQFNRDQDAMQLMLNKSEREKQEATKKFQLISRNFDSTNNYQITQENNTLFKTAKYAINGFENQPLNQESQHYFQQELPYSTTKVQVVKRQPSVQTVIVKNQKELQEESKIYFLEENNIIHSQSIINIMNDLNYHRRVQTSQDKQSEIESIKPKPYKTEGQSASVSFTKEIQKNYEPQSLEQQHEPIHHIEFNKKEQIKEEKIDLQIDDLLEEIQGLVDNSSKNQVQSLVSSKLKQQTERNQIQLVLDRGENFQPVQLLNTQIILQDSKVLDNRIKDENLENLDRLIFELCN